MVPEAQSPSTAVTGGPAKVVPLTIASCLKTVSIVPKFATARQHNDSGQLHDVIVVYDGPVEDELARFRALHDCFILRA